MFSEDMKILEFHRYQKSNKTPCVIYADLESLIKKVDRFSISTAWTFGGRK